MSKEKKILVKVGQIWGIGVGLQYEIVRVTKGYCYYKNIHNSEELPFGPLSDGYGTWRDAYLIKDVDGNLYTCPVCRQNQCKTSSCE